VVLLRCGIVSGRGNGRVVVSASKWTRSLGKGNVVRRHNLDSFWGLRSRCRPQKRAQIANLGLELVHVFLPVTKAGAARQKWLANRSIAAARAAQSRFPFVAPPRRTDRKERARQLKKLFHNSAPRVERHVMIADF
jgi:hypothetical protein